MTAVPALSEMEEKVMNLSVLGLGPKAIGIKLHRSPSTVNTYIGRVQRKMGAPTRREAIIWFIRKQLAGDVEYVSWSHS